MGMERFTCVRCFAHSVVEAYIFGGKSLSSSIQLSTLQCNRKIVSQNPRINPGSKKCNPKNYLRNCLLRIVNLYTRKLVLKTDFFGIRIGINEINIQICKRF